MSRQQGGLPERLALLPEAVAVKNLTRGVLTGQEEPPRVALVRAASPLSGSGLRWNSVPLRELVDHVMRMYAAAERTQADAWLAPRLHATLRMTRAEAADPGLWNFIALVTASDYVVWRHRSTKEDSKGSSPAVTADRFCGPHYKQAFARLWWAAELFRDGDDYRPVEIACSNQDVLNTVLRLDLIDHRPAARAVTRLIEQNTVCTGREVNGLASAINAAGSTLMYDVLAPDDGTDADALHHWISEGDMAPPAPRRSLPDGPDDGRIPPASVDAMVQRFEKIFAEAPIRGKAEKEPVRSAGVSLDKVSSAA